MNTKHIVHLYGASGAGTTTLGRYIANQLGYIHLDTDDFYWLPIEPKYTYKRPVEERLRLMKKEIEGDKGVVISGSLTGWGDVLIPYFTLAIHVITDTNLRIKRLKHREYLSFGERILPGGDMFNNHQEFLTWASEYDTGDATMRSKSCHDEWRKLLSCPFIEVDGSRELSYNYSLINTLLEVTNVKKEEGGW